MRNRGRRGKRAAQTWEAAQAWESAGRTPADRASFAVFQTLRLAVATRLLPQTLRGGETLVARAPPKETRAAKAARLRD